MVDSPTFPRLSSLPSVACVAYIVYAMLSMLSIWSMRSIAAVSFDKCVYSSAVVYVDACVDAYVLCVFWVCGCVSVHKSMSLRVFESVCGLVVRVFTPDM